MTTDYNKQAGDFLEKTGTTMTLHRIPQGAQRAPLWAKEGERHGNEYRVTLKRDKQQYTFSFWDSIANLEKHERPRPYDILACLDTYIDDSYSLQEFMQEYGYDVEQVDTAQKTLQAVQEQTRALRRLYNGKELEELNEIN